MSNQEPGQPNLNRHVGIEIQRARLHRDALRERIHEQELRYNRYQRELDEKRHLLAYATPEDDALEIAKATAMIPVYEQTIARLRPDMHDAQQELVVAERVLRELTERQDSS